MPNDSRIYKDISIDRIFLHHENPRHEPYHTQAEVIEYLCRDEEVAQLARDISQKGLSPFDRFGVMKTDPADNDSAYYMTEGNRRLCALKLLSDPDLSPPERKSYFEKLAESWTPISVVECWVSDDETETNFWLKRRHHGPAGGVGQKSWNSDQKSRHSGSGNRNRIGLAFLDYAENEGLISAEDRKRKLTTAQRYLGNPIMREAMGIDATDPDDVLRNRNDRDFKLLAQRFVADMMGEDPKVHSRNNKDKIVEYARGISSISGLTHERITAEPLSKAPEKRAKKARRKKPGKARSRHRLPYEDSIARALKDTGVWKTQSLYRSICDVPLQENTPLLAVGVWSFFEALTAGMGRKSGNSFASFLSTSRLQNYGLGDRKKVKPLLDALDRILHFGNTTKHHGTSAAFNGDQLANDMETLTELILKCIKDVKTN